MSFDPVFYILKEANFLPATGAPSWLGKIVNHYSAPHYGSVPDDATSLNQRGVKTTELSDVQQVVRRSKGTSYEPRLEGVIKACAKKTDSVEYDFKTAKLRILQLQNHEEVFAQFMRLCAQNKSIDARIRSWAKPFGEPLYMIVGVMIWTDAEFNSRMASDRDMSVQPMAPLNALINAFSASHFGSPIVAPGTGDLSFGFNTVTGQQTALDAKQSGSSIFAVEYRVIRRLKHTAFTRFGLDSELPRFPGQRTMSEDRERADVQAAEEVAEKPERLKLEDDDVPWTESLDDLDEALAVEVEQISGMEVGLCFASDAET